MRGYDRESLEEHLMEQSESLEECAQAFEHWVESNRHGRAAWEDYKELMKRADTPVMEYRDLSNQRTEEFFKYVLSQTHTHGMYWQDYYVSKGVEAYEGARGDAMMDDEREGDL